MAYMVMQRYTTAILEAYGGIEDVTPQLAAARSHRMWLEGLEIEPGVRAALVEQAKAVEDAFARLARRGR